MSESEPDDPLGQKDVSADELVSASPPVPFPEPNELVRLLQPVLRPGLEEQAAELLGDVVAIERRTATAYAGPLPPASELSEYDRVLPGAADRIVAMAEREQSARHRVRDIVYETEATLKRRGQPYAFSALIVLCLLSVAFLLKGYPTQGVTLAVALVILVTAMFLGPEMLKIAARLTKEDERANSEINEQGETAKSLPEPQPPKSPAEAPPA